MHLVDYLEQDKDKLMAQWENQPEAHLVVPVLEKQIDRIQIAYHASCEREPLRALSSSLLQTLRMSIQFADTLGDVKIWTREDAVSKKDRRWMIPSAAGLLMLVMSLLLSGMFWPKEGNQLVRLLSAVLIIGALICLAAGLYLCKKAGKGTAGKKDSQIKAEPNTDAVKLYRILRASLQVADRELEELEGQLIWEERRAKDSENIELREKELSPSALQLMGDLLEAAYSGDGEFALERLALVRHYLHALHVDAVDYDQEHSAWFDIMPAKMTQTLRPALVQEGKVLLRGLAAGGE